MAFAGYFDIFRRYMISVLRANLSFGKVGIGVGHGVSAVNLRFFSRARYEKQRLSFQNILGICYSYSIT